MLFNTRKRKITFFALFAALLVGIAVVAFFTMSDHETNKKAGIRASEPTIVSSRELRDFAADKNSPLYWAGTQKSTQLELTQTKSGDMYVRYLTGKAKAGDQRAIFMTVGTYPQDKAYATLAKQKDEKGVLSLQAPGGGLAIYRKDQLNVYLAYPAQDVIVEVYAPEKGEALELIADGEIGVVA